MHIWGTFIGNSEKTNSQIRLLFCCNATRILEKRLVSECYIVVFLTKLQSFMHSSHDYATLPEIATPIYCISPSYILHLRGDHTVNWRCVIEQDYIFVCCKTFLNFKVDWKPSNCIPLLPLLPLLHTFIVWKGGFTKISVETEKYSLLQILLGSFKATFGILLTELEIRTILRTILLTELEVRSSY